MKIAVKTA